MLKNKLYVNNIIINKIKFLKKKVKNLNRDITVYILIIM